MEYSLSGCCCCHMGACLKQLPKEAREEQKIKILQVKNYEPLTVFFFFFVDSTWFDKLHSKCFKFSIHCSIVTFPDIICDTFTSMKRAWMCQYVCI